MKSNPTNATPFERYQKIIVSIKWLANGCAGFVGQKSTINRDRCTIAMRLWLFFALFLSYDFLASSNQLTFIRNLVSDLDIQFISWFYGFAIKPTAFFAMTELNCFLVRNVKLTSIYLIFVSHRYFAASNWFINLLTWARPFH